MNLQDVIDTLGESLNKNLILKWSVTQHPIIKANMVHKSELYELVNGTPKPVVDFRRDYPLSNMDEALPKTDLEFLKLVFDEYTSK